MRLLGSVYMYLGVYVRELRHTLDSYLNFSNFSFVFKLSVANFLWFPCSKDNFNNIFIYFKLMLMIGKENKCLFLGYKVCFNPLYKIQFTTAVS